MWQRFLSVSKFSSFGSKKRLNLFRDESCSGFDFSGRHVMVESISLIEHVSFTICKQSKTFILFLCHIVANTHFRQYLSAQTNLHHCNTEYNFYHDRQFTFSQIFTCNYHSAGKHDRRHYTHHTIYPLYPLYYYTPFIYCFPGIKTHRKQFSRHF